MQISVSYEFLPKTPSVHAAVVMDHFGVGFETGRHVIAEQLDLPIQPGDVVAFTGPSGSGKSSLMRAAAAQLDGVLCADTLDLGDRILVDALSGSAQDGLGLLANCGLGEAHLMLRTPAELSDGQRYRFRLALAVSQSPRWIVADEFTAALDRPLAKVIAFNLRKLASRTGIGFLVATTHADILADLQPDVHVRCSSSCATAVSAVRAENTDLSLRTADTVVAPKTVKKKTSVSPTSCGCRPAPQPTGRTSLGGITARIRSPSSGT